MAVGISGAASGGQLEEKIDYSAETQQKLEQARQLASSDLAAALALLAPLEKKCRTHNDTKSLQQVCKVSLELCYEQQDYEAVLQQLPLLANKRSQKTTAISTLVHTTMPWCMVEPYAPKDVPNVNFRDKLVVVLRDLTDGKIFLERERAQLTRVLASIKERQGDIAEAADILQQVHVETYGSLSKTDKVEFILEQMRLTLAKHDFVRAAIVAGKISRKHLSEEHMQTYKVHFYELQTQYHRHERDALELAKDYHAIYLTPSVQQDVAAWTAALQSTVLFLALAPHGNEQQDLMHHVQADANLEKLPVCKSTVDLFLKKEIIHYPMPRQDELEALPAFALNDLTSHWRDTLHRRVIQHNLRVVATYYTHITGARLAQLLQLDGERLEHELARLVSDGVLYCKINRPADVIRFAQQPAPEKILTDWSSQIDTLLSLVETTTHLIHKENMVGKSNSTAAANAAAKH